MPWVSENSKESFGPPSPTLPVTATIIARTGSISSQSRNPRVAHPYTGCCEMPSANRRITDHPPALSYSSPPSSFPEQCIVTTPKSVKPEREERMKLGLSFSRIIFGVTALLIVIPLISVQSLEAQALDGTLKKIKDSSTMNLGYLADAPPFSFLGPDKKPTGYSVELCTRIAGSIQKQLNVNLKLNWVAITAENRISMVEQGKV